MGIHRDVDRLERERDEARADAARLRTELTMASVNDRARDAEFDAKRLREVLTQVREAMRATGQEPDGPDDPRRPLAAAVWAALER